MKRFARFLLATFGLGALGFGISLVPQKTAVGAGGAPVFVENTPLPVSGTVAATQSGAWNVGISGTPNVNVATLPPVTGNVNATLTGTPTVNVASLSGNISVANPVDGEFNQIPLLTKQFIQTFDVEQSCTFTGSVCQFGNFVIISSGTFAKVEYLGLNCGSQVQGSVSIQTGGTNRANSTAPVDHFLLLPTPSGTPVSQFGQNINVYAGAGNGPAGLVQNAISMYIQSVGDFSGVNCLGTLTGYTGQLGTCDSSGNCFVQQ